MKREALLEVKDLVKQFDIHRSFRPTLHLRAVNGVSFSIFPGETFGLVGESGCGKSTLGRTIMGLYEASAGSVWFSGAEISRLSGAARQPYQRRMQMIFQDPYSSLNPAMQVRHIVAEPLALKDRGHYRREAGEDQIRDILVRVGMSPDDMFKYPHEFSGGQRQRISIARALIVHPEFVLCDEPISALDVSIQAQVVNLLEDLQEEIGLTYLFVAHDLSMVRYISHRIGVMYRGEIVEISTAREIYQNPLHPYTQSLLSAIPIPDPARAAAWMTAVPPETLDPGEDPRGCPFFARCPRAAPPCREEHPVLRDAGEQHQVACRLT
jgi:oligopeptide/dipeptide ABC transporter ATP-binding protein